MRVLNRCEGGNFEKRINSETRDDHEPVGK